MNLLFKFAILVSMLAGMMVIAVGFPTWAMATVDRNVVHDQEEIVRTLNLLKGIESSTEGVLNRLNRGSFDDIDQKRVRKEFRQMNSIATELAESQDFRTMAGAGLAPSLLSSVHEIGATISEIEDDSICPNLDPVQVAHVFENLSVVVGMIRDQLEGNIYYSILHSGSIRSLVNRILISSLIAACLVAGLSFLLLRRWVIVPVLELRTAAVAISQGNFDYRVTIRSRDEIGALSSEINHMAATIADMQARTVARERLSAIEELLRRLVHNLRNPLAGIRGLAEASCLELPADSQIREDQNLIIAMVDRFEKWLGNLLHSTASLNIHPVEESPADLVQMVTDTLQPLAQSRSINLEVIIDNAPALAPYDPTHLEQALIALATNALEATPKEGTVCIEADTPGETETTSQTPVWRLRIDDSGPGIPESARHDIFQPYFTTKSHGTGLGLAFVQNVVHAHGGSVCVVESHLGGAGFVVELPLHLPDESKTQCDHHAETGRSQHSENRIHHESTRACPAHHDNDTANDMKRTERNVNTNHPSPIPAP